MSEPKRGRRNRVEATRPGGSPFPTEARVEAKIAAYITLVFGLTRRPGTTGSSPDNETQVPAFPAQYHQPRPIRRAGVSNATTRKLRFTLNHYKCTSTNFSTALIIASKPGFASSSVRLPTRIGSIRTTLACGTLPMR